jgi:hypothetical protein
MKSVPPAIPLPLGEGRERVRSIRVGAFVRGESGVEPPPEERGQARGPQRGSPVGVEDALPNHEVLQLE